MTSSPDRLDEYDKREWFDVMQQFRPSLTEEEFDIMWAEFQAEKRRRAAH
jgi:hypothetical protein